MLLAQEVLYFWFEEIESRQWFITDPAFDELIQTRFGELYSQAVAGELDSWAAEAESALALVIILDQFPRNMFRDTPESFASDAQALSVALAAIAAGLDRQVAARYRTFFYMPLMHAEDLAVQERCVELFAKLAKETRRPNKYAAQHRDIIARFGRFPHRNELLGRESSAAEIAFLKEAGAAF